MGYRIPFEVTAAPLYETVTQGLAATLGQCMGCGNPAGIERREGIGRGRSCGTRS